jgi:predicted ribosomally synthesized peptide with SipW-like signal peptide
MKVPFYPGSWVALRAPRMTQIINIIVITYVITSKSMRKILISSLTIAVLALIVSSGTIAFFRDQEVSVGNTYTAGTIDIAVNGENSWAGNFVWEDIKPGKCFDTTLNIENVGDNPLRLWKVIKCLDTEENDIIEPEQEWYNANPLVSPKNDIDTALTYEMYVDGYMVVNTESGITVAQIKDNYINLRPLDFPFTAGEKDGTLDPGGTITVTQRYCMPEDVGNWAQSDQMTFVIELEARQTDMTEPLPQLAFYDNKYPSWDPTADETIGMLKYEYQGPEFLYDFYGTGMEDSEEMCLIYYRDSDPNHVDMSTYSHILIDKGFSVNGELLLAGQTDVGGDMPYEVDENYPYGAKVWLVTCSQFNQVNNTLSWGNPAYWLFDNWPGFINYRQGIRPDFQFNCEYDENNNPPSQEEVVYLNKLGGDIGVQYGYQHDYSEAANDNVYLTYNTPMGAKFSGTMTASGLKPFATYQVKLIGVPDCADPGNGDDMANDYIGYKGRWTCTDCVCTGSACNRTDAQYKANSYYVGDSSECIAGYLVLDYFTADANGDIELSDVNIYGDTAGHVLYCDNDSGNCNSNNLNTYLAYLDPSHDSGDAEPVQFCPYDKVNIQPEPGRTGCSGLFLSSGSYYLRIVLTEESFHQGNWATVLEGDISFQVN